MKNQAERAIAQTKDEHFSATLDANANSIAVIMGHLVGNMHSRASMWRLAAQLESRIQNCVDVET